MFKKLFGFNKKEKEAEESQVENLDSGEVSEFAETEIAIQEPTLVQEEEDKIIESFENSFKVEEEETIEEIKEEKQTESFAKVIEEEEVVEEEPAKEKKGFFAKLKDGLLKTRTNITDKIEDLVYNYGEIDEDLLEELEEILITADVGMETTMKIIDELRDELKVRKITDSKDIKPVLKDVLSHIMTNENEFGLNVNKSPSVIFVIGVNGAGKTTSIGKIANNLMKDDKTVLLAAADTFRAAAIDQLKVWGERAGVTVVSHSEGSDPAAVVYDSIQAAKAKNVDVLICDTAGRLHNKVNLMKELAKMFRTVEKEFPDAEKEVLLVLDATTGQNALQQAKLFKESADITGIVLTKLDGTAKGGVVLAINSELGIPVKLIGVGEGIDDMQKFNPQDFVDALITS